MLYINGKTFDQTEQAFKDQYYKAIERLRQVSNSTTNRFSVTFKIKQQAITWLKNPEGGYFNATGEQFVNFNRNVYDKELNRTVNWLYSDSPLPETGKGTVDLNAADLGKWFFQQDKISETVHDEELAFFLYHVDPRFGEKSKGSYAYLVDVRGENEKVLERKAPVVEFEYMIYHPSSPLRSNKETLKTVARAWGIESVDDRAESDLVVALEKAVNRGEQEKQKGNRMARGTSEFLEDAKLDDKTRIRSLVQKAADRDVIAVNKKSSQSGVYWLDQYGIYGEKIISLTPRNKDMWIQQMADYLMTNTTVLNLLEEELGEGIIEEELGKGKKERKQGIFELEEDASFQDLQTFFDDFYREDMKSTWREVAKRCDIKSYARRKSEVKEELIQYFKDQYGFEYKETTIK